MKIVFFSAATTSKIDTSMQFISKPSRADAWDEMDREYPDCEFVVVGARDAREFFDLKNGEVYLWPEHVKYVLLKDGASVEETVEVVAAEKPDVAIAVPFATIPHDWMPIKTSLIAEGLQKMGIQTLANNTTVSVAAFDKWRTNIMFRSFIKAAKAVYVHNNLYWAEKKLKEGQLNVYKEYILHRVKEMDFPVLVKDTLGAGSIGIEVMNSYEEVEQFLNSEKNDADVLVEEFIKGEQFGTEIHGVKGRYSVLPPIALSVNEEGITEQKSVVKFGPVTDPKYHYEEVQETLLNMAQQLGFEGTVQVDLVYKDGQWYIIEINPRWSGMTVLTAAMEGRNPYAIFADSVLGLDKNYSMPRNLKHVINFITKAMPEDMMDKLYQNPNIAYLLRLDAEFQGVGKMSNCLVVVSTDKEKEDILVALEELNKEYPGLVSEKVIEKAKKMID